MSSRGFEFAWKSVVFRVFPAVFARSLLIQQRRGNGRRLVHKMTNDFACYFDRWIIFSLGYLSWKIFWGLKIILWSFSRYSSCFMWNVEIGRSSGRRAERFFREAIVCGKMTAFWEDSGRLSNSKMNMLDDIKLFPVLPVLLFPVLLQLPTLEIGTGFWLLSLLTFYMLFLYSLQWREKPEGVGSAVDPLREIYVSILFFFPVVSHWEFTRSIDFLMQSFSIFFDLF